MFLVQRKLKPAFVALDVVVRYPESRDACPKGAGKVAEWVEEAIVDDLVEEGEWNVGNEDEKDVQGRYERSNLIRKRHNEGARYDWNEYRDILLHQVVGHSLEA